MRRTTLLAALLSFSLPAVAAPPALLVERHRPLSAPSPDRFARGSVKCAGKQALIALTFDDGPSPKVTPLVLDELARRGLPATFFVNSHRLGGKSVTASESRRLLLEAAARGHDIGNHTFDHARLSDIDEAEQTREIVAGDDGITRVTGERSHLFRPPFGRLTEFSATLLAQRGSALVMWNLSSEDPYLRTPDRVADQLRSELSREGGGVILMHDTHPWTAAALPLFLDFVAEENCRRTVRGEEPFLFVTLDRFFQPRYGLPTPHETARRTEDDRRRRRQIAEACKSGRAQR